MFGEKTRRILGEFELGKKAVISDPCYDRPDDINRSNAVVDVEPGAWKAEVTLSDEGAWGNRVAELRAWCKDSTTYNYSWQYLTSCGVDSGQLGIFDYDKYPIGVNGYDSEYDNPDNWYRKACNETFDEKNPTKKAGIVESMGVNSSSGFGDGVYEVYVMRNKADQVVSIKAIFIGDNDDDYD